MSDFLIVAALLVLATVALGLARLLRGPGDVDRMMSIQLLGTGGIAALLLLGAGVGTDATVDVALTLALLAAYAAFAFAKARLDELDAPPDAAANNGGAPAAGGAP